MVRRSYAAPDPLLVRYQRAAARWSDVQGHLPTFIETVETLDAQRVVELGTRRGISTIAWLYGLSRTGGHLWTVDLAPRPTLRLGGRSARWTHVQGDDTSDLVLAALPEQVDVVFIDTSHDYAHTLVELRLYSRRVRPGGVVLLHDTDVETPAGVDPQAGFPVRRALDRFCSESGLTWANTEGSYGLGRIEIPSAP